MPTKRSTADKLKKPLSYLLLFLFLLAGTLYYYINGETEAPGFSDWASDYTPDGMEVHFLDVGQGDSTLLLCGESAVLVDGGEQEYGYEIVDYLRRHGVEKIDLLIATHRHSDHIGGLTVVLQKMDVDAVLLNDSAAYNADSQAESDFLEQLQFSGITASVIESESVYEYNGMRLTAVQCKKEDTDENENGIVIRAEYEETSVLLPGDIGSMTELELLSGSLLLDCDILKVPHHGSNHSGGEAFISATSPGISVISCGKNNRYNHPGEETLNRLRQANSAVYRTDIMGTIAFSCNNTIENISDGKEE